MVESKNIENKLFQIMLLQLIYFYDFINCYLLMSCKFCSGRNVLMVVCEQNCFIFELLFLERFLENLYMHLFQKKKLMDACILEKKYINTINFGTWPIDICWIHKINFSRYILKNKQYVY